MLKDFKETKTVWCVPYAIGAVTGTHPDEIVKIISRFRNTTTDQISWLGADDCILTLSQLGVKPKMLTTADRDSVVLLKDLQKEYPEIAGHKALVSLISPTGTGHQVAIHYGFVTDNHYRKATAIEKTVYAESPVSCFVLILV